MSKKYTVMANKLPAVSKKKRKKDLPRLIIIILLLININYVSSPLNFLLLGC